MTILKTIESFIMIKTQKAKKDSKIYSCSNFFVFIYFSIKVEIFDFLLVVISFGF
jgi:hypothetical protein